MLNIIAFADLRECFKCLTGLLVTRSAYKHVHCMLVVVTGSVWSRKPIASFAEDLGLTRSLWAIL